MKLKNNTTLLFIGDSITDCGRSRPVGKDDGLGYGYVSLADSLLASVYPERKITILNTGISGNRVIDLESRWQHDVLDLKPDWLSVMIGINDVWRQFDSPFSLGQVTHDRFESTYRRILQNLPPDLKGLILMSPYMIQPDRDDPMCSMMNGYGRTVKQLAEEYNALFVNIQTAFDQYLENRSWQSLCDDHVHPNQTGHMIIAKAFLDKMDFKWN